MLRFKNYRSYLIGVLSILSLASCSAADFVRIKTTDGYLSQTRIQLPERVSEDIGRIVFLREKTQNKNIPSVFLNDRFVGSLPPKRFSESLVCPGEQAIRVGTRTDAVMVGENIPYTAKPGATSYFQVYEQDAEKFGIRELSEEEARQLAKGLDQSHIINRHQPICNAPLAVLKQINLGADALFKFDTAQMLSAGQASVNKLVNDIRALGAQVEQIRVTGYTDRLGADAYNNRLSLERARTVAKYMKKQGLDTTVVIAGRGKQNPVLSCKGDKASVQLIRCLQPNRRVTIELLGVVQKVENKSMSSK
jgi:outer membrane protein OmpA-like peptidoglycan-associated protein